MLDLALLILRAAVGLTFAAHGAQKAFGWWDGPGPTGWRGAIERMGFRPTDLFVALSVGVELVGGLMLALGLVTPFAAAVLVAQSIVIIGRAHWEKGFFSTKGGFEFPLVLGLVAAAICLAGAGGISLDAVLRLPLPDPVRAAVLPLAVAGGLASLLIPDVMAERAPNPSGDASAARERARGSQLRRG
jgi:putative oxidoreductase